MATIMSAAEFERVVADARDRTEQMQREGRRLIAVVRRWTVALGPQGAGLDAMLSKIDSQINQTGNLVTEFFMNPGVPWTLWSHGSDWAGPPIAGQISSQISRATLDEMRVDDFWTGVAADAYKNSLPRQKEAMSALAASARTIDDVLTSMAIAIGAFWLAFLAALVEVVLIIMACVAAASTGVGAPAGAGGAAAAVAKFVGVTLAILSAFYTFIMVNTVPKIKDLEQDLHDNAAYPGGHWPRPTVDLADGRSSDGDPSDWNLKG
ncbi:MAG: hypothetical protein HOV77_16735 [Hamadaea sp.]|uniref:hypothetical protein n=1 Tax=Hamadaea sp. TaxID=2024425 RepID=UPI001797BCAE|nr:hypothetical protein [Hamadaea sp.]NUT20828.1 hypothetical protein [Hamadaea sp.]